MNGCRGIAISLQNQWLWSHESAGNSTTKPTVACLQWFSSDSMGVGHVFQSWAKGIVFAVEEQLASSIPDQAPNPMTS